MGNDLLNVVREHGLPGWTVLVIGGGTIIAAVISFIGAIAIAWVNAFAAVRLDREKALRDHRRANVAAARDYVHKSAKIVGTGRIELSRADDGKALLERAFDFLRTLDDSGKELGALHIDGQEVQRAAYLYFKSGRLLGLAVTSVEPSEREPFGRIEPYFELVMSVAGATMDATDAYVFPTRGQKRLAKKRLDACAD
ncbi:MAG: hypothetical protein ACRD3J_27060, partial [Thermoanaerobaculia bacterium]